MTFSPREFVARVFLETPLFRVRAVEYTVDILERQLFRLNNKQVDQDDTNDVPDPEDEVTFPADRGECRGKSKGIDEGDRVGYDSLEG